MFAPVLYWTWTNDAGAVPPAAPAAYTPAGRRTKRRRILVEIGKDTIEVNSESEAIELLHEARGRIETKAPALAAKAAARSLRSGRSPALNVPAIRISPDTPGSAHFQAQVDVVRGQIEETYRALLAQAVTAHVAALEQDDEDAIMALFG